MTNVAVIRATTNVATPDWQDLIPQPTIISDGNANRTEVMIQPGTLFLRAKY